MDKHNRDHNKTNKEMKKAVDKNPQHKPENNLGGKADSKKA